jgi:hypothetical protein
MLQGEYGYFEIVIGNHSYGDIPALKALELSSSLLDIWFENIAEALIMLRENPIVYVGDIDSPFSWIQFQVSDKDNITVSLLKTKNKLYTKLVQTTLNSEIEKKWVEIVKVDELYLSFKEALNSYILELKALNPLEDKRIVKLQELQKLLYLSD